ncbi:MFS transporter superfamily, partial [Sesbania bispinosa]
MAKDADVAAKPNLHSWSFPDIWAGPRVHGLDVQSGSGLLLEGRSEVATLNDAFPVRGYRRRPYFVIAGVIGTFSAAIVALSPNLAAAAAVLCFIGVSASLAIADVTIDACIARNSIEIPSLAPDLQSLCGFCSSFGALLGYLGSGFFVHHLGPQ